MYWSVGVSQPGAQVVVGNVPPPHRVYVPAPVVVTGHPVYAPVPVVMQPVPVYPVAQPVWVPPGHRHWHHGWRSHHERMEHRGPQGHYELAPSDRR